MRITLSETGRARKRSPLGTTVSVVLHATLFVMVAAGAGMSNQGPPEKPHRDILVYTPTPVVPHTPRPATSGPTHSTWNPSAPPPIPGRVEITVPDFRNVGDHLLADGGPLVEFGHATLAQTTGVSRSDATVSDVYDVRAVEVPAKTIGNQAPRYPSVLSTAGIEGSVVVRYVVDTLGHVEQGSVTTVSTTHALFERAVRDALPRFRFSSAQVGGRKVRQLVEQSFAFELRR